MDAQKVADDTYLIEPEGEMRVPGLVYASAALFAIPGSGDALQQVANVAALPGIVTASIAMPDMHWGYGFPIGGVAAVDARDGVISPGGVGFDINCGVRLIRTGLGRDDVAPEAEHLLHELMRRIPQGANDRGVLTVTPKELRRLVERGLPWMVERGYASEEDALHTEDGGVVPGASADAVTSRAIERGHTQIGSLGAGNHFLELQVVDEVFDRETADAWGLASGQVVVMIHSGSRGFGHQTCTDFLRHMTLAAQRYGIELPDRQLACAPVDSPEGREYLAAMAAAANFAFCNRQMMMHEVRHAFERVFARPWERLGIELVYDVAHNIAKLEEHEVEGETRRVWVHRKGATRAFGPGRPELPPDYRKTGQPVIVPGDMGSESWLLAGTEQAAHASFGSCAHGAGRRMSRGAARRAFSGAEVRDRLERRGIVVKSQSGKLLAEEGPHAYKDVAEVVRVVERVGLARKVCRMKPLGVLKG